jgi:hypothetical protein
VTNKWGANSIGAALPEGSYSTEMMPESNPDPSPDPMLGLGALGYWGESAVDSVSDALTPESAAEDWADVERDAGYLLAAGANAGAEVVKGLWNISTGEVGKAGNNISKMGNYLTDANPDDDSVVWIAANMARNAGQSAIKAPVEAVMDVGEDLVNWGTGLLGGPVRPIAGFGAVSPGLGNETADKIENWGENTAAFGKGFVSRLLPDALVEQYEKHPMAYSIGLGGLILMGIPFIGPTIARTIGSSAPQVFKAVAKSPGAMFSGLIEGGRMLGDSVSSAVKPSKRGTAATRGLTQRRGSANRRRRY